MPSNKGMKLSKPEYLGGGWPISPVVSESGFAAYARCSADYIPATGATGKMT